VFRLKDIGLIDKNIINYKVLIEIPRFTPEFFGVCCNPPSAALLHRRRKIGFASVCPEGTKTG